MKQFNNETIGNLYIVATPIGNMGDVTLRAIEILKSVDLVVCEDTRVSGLLLHKLEIKKPLKAIHQHSLEKSIDEVIAELLAGRSVAYVTDNGTPGISDPGQKLIQNVNIKNQNDNENIKIIPIPGASAVTSAISVSGLVDKEFYFAGFLPKKKGRQTQLKHLSVVDVPIVIYESAFRIEKTLDDIKEYFGAETQVFIAREMTKMFEEYWGGTIKEVAEDLNDHKLKGEFVLIIKRSKIKN